MTDRSTLRSSGRLRAVAAAAGLAVLAASGFAVYLHTNEKRPSSEQDLMRPAREPRALPELPFQDAQGKLISLADSRGKVVQLNVWATWCAPCRKEMPALDRVSSDR